MYLKKELYELIRADESIFDFIQEDSIDGLWYWDLENPENEWMNPKFWTTLGYNPDEMPHKSAAWQSIINQEDLKVSLDNFTKHCENPNYPYDQIVRYTHKNGSTVWIRCRGMAIRDNTGKPIRMLGAHQDITEQMKMQKETSILASMLDVAPNSITVHDNTGRFLYANHKTFEIHGYSPEEFMALNLHELDVPESAELIEKRIKTIQENNQATFEVEHLRKDGSKFPLEVFVKLVDWKGSQAMLSIATDITGRKQAQHDLEASETQYRRLFESAHDGILILNAETGRIVDINPFLLKLTGYSREDFLDQHLWEIGPIKDIVASKVSFAELQDKEYIRYEDLPLKTKDGREINVEFVSNVYLVNSRKVIQCNIRDITERKRAEEALRINQERLSETARLAKVGGWEIDLINNNLSWTEETFRIHELESNQSIDIARAINYYHQDDRKKVSDAVQQAIERGIDFDFEARLITELKNQLFVRVIGNVIYNNEKACILRGMIQDITVQKQIEIKNQLLTSIVEKSQDFIGLATPDQQAFYVNPAGQKMLGIDNEEMVRKTKIEEYFFPEDIPFVKNTIFPQLMQEGRWVGEFRFKHFKTGEPIDVYYDLFLTEDPVSKEITIFSTITRDITLQKKTERELIQAKEKAEESEEKYRTIFDKSLVSILVADDKGNYLSANDSASQLLGYSVEEILKMNVGDLKTTYAPDANERYLKYLQTGEEIGEFDFITKTNEKRIAFYHAKRIGTDFNLSMLIDVTQKKQTELELQEAKEKSEESEERFNLAMRASQDGIFDWNLETNEIYYSPGWKRMLGYEEHELPNDFSVWEKTTAPEDVKKSWELQQKLITKQIDRFVIEFKMKHKAGHWIDVLARAEAIFNENGKAVRIVGTHTDITERKKAESIIKMNEENLRNIADTMQETVSVIAMDGTFLYANQKAALNLWGDKTDNIIGMNIREMIPKERAESLIETYRSVYQSGKPFNQEIEISLKTSNRWFFNTLKPIEYGIPPIMAVLSVSLDITDRKRAEESLRESEEKFSKAFHTSPVILGLSELETGKYVEVNQTFYDTLGFSPEETIGTRANELVRMDFKFREDTIKEMKEQGYIRNKETVIYTKNGEPLNVLLSAEILRIQDKSYNFTSVLNITTLKQTEEELRQSEEHFRFLVENSYDLIWKLKSDGILSYVSQSWKVILGYEPSYIMGKAFQPIVHPDDVNNCELFMLRVLDIKKALSGQQYRVMHANGTWRWHEASLTPVFADNGTFLHFVGVSRDITERKKAEELLLQQNQQLEQQYEEYMQLNEILRLTNYDLEIAKEKAEESDLLKTAFLQNMSHEIRTPLNGILGFSNLLQDDNLCKDDIKEFTSIISHSGQRLLEIINNVLDISKIETGQMHINNSEFSLNSMLSNLFSFFSPSAEAKKIKLSYSSSLGDTNCQIVSDDTKINQILTNLINNAIKFTAEGSIDFGFEIVNDEVQFHVKDSGIGISEEYHGKIFERFTQVDLKMTRGFEGAGLGLAICKGLVEKLGGRIWLESEVNKGSTFFFTIPYLPAKQKGVNNLQKNLGIGFKNKTKILIAEDDHTSFQYLSKILIESHFILIQAENGEKAVDYAKNIPDIDLVLMDIRMPVMDGFEATMLIKAIRPDLPIIAQTAYAFLEEKEKILSIGCDDYLSKPIEKEKLLNLIKKYVV